MAVRVLLDSLNVFFEAINWAINYFSDNASSARLFSAEEKYFRSSEALLAFWKPSYVAFKHCSSLNLLYYNTKNMLKLDHVLYTIGFLSQYLNVSV